MFFLFIWAASKSFRDTLQRLCDPNKVEKTVLEAKQLNQGSSTETLTGGSQMKEMGEVGGELSNKFYIKQHTLPH